MTDPLLERYNRLLVPTLEEQQEEQSTFQSGEIDPLLRRYMNITSLEPTGVQAGEITIGGLKYEKPDLATQMRMELIEKAQPELPTGKKIARGVYALSRGIAGTGTLGLAPKILGAEEIPHPTTTEQLLEEAGRFVGFLGLPLKGANLIVKTGGKIAPYITRGLAKLLPKTPKLGGAAIRTLGKYLGQQVATLSIASGLSEIGEKPELKETLDRMKGGAKVGAVFGITGLINPTKYPGLNLLLRQVGSRVMGALGGVYSFEGLSPQTFFNELLYTYFSAKGTRPSEVIAKELGLYKKELERLKKEAIEKLSKTLPQLPAKAEAAPRMLITKEGLKPIEGEILFEPKEVIREVQRRLETETPRPEEMKPEPEISPEEPIAKTEAEKQFVRGIYEKLRTGQELSSKEKEALSQMGIYEEVKPGVAEGAIEPKIAEGLEEIPIPEGGYKEVYMGINPFKDLKKLDEALLKAAEKTAREKVEELAIEELTPEPKEKLTEKIKGRIRGVIDYSPDKPYTLKTKEPIEIVKQFNENSQVVARHEAEALKDIQDLPPKKIKYWIENPIRIFEDYPILKKLLYDPIKAAEKGHYEELDSIRKLVKRFKKMPNVSAKRLGIYAIAQQRDGKAILKSMGITKIPKLTPQEIEIYNQTRKILQETFNRINRARELAGLDPIPEVENYFTFVRNLKTLEQLGHSVLTESDMKFLERHLNATPFKYAVKRQHIKAPVELNFFDVFENYMNTALRHIYKSPVIAKGRLLLSEIELPSGEKVNLKEQAPILSDYVERWLDYNAGQRIPTHVPEWLNRAAYRLSRNIGMAILSYNVRSALIQPTALRNSYIELGTKFLLDGIIDNAKPEKRNFAMKTSNVLKGRMFDVQLADFLESTFQRRWGRVQRKVARVGTFPLQWLDLETARITWLGAYKKGITPINKGGLGLTPKEARVYADDVVVKTQASAALSDIAMIQQTPMGKLGTIFQTFVINEWNFLAKDVFKSPKPTPEKAVQIARLVLSTALINALFEKVFRLRSPYPSPEWEIAKAVKERKEPTQIVGAGLKEMMEQLPIIGGAIRWSRPYRIAWPASLQTVEGALRLLTKMISEPDLRKFNKNDFETVGRLLGIPGTSQVMKYIRRRQKGLSHAEAILGIRTQ